MTGLDAERISSCLSYSQSVDPTPRSNHTNARKSQDTRVTMSRDRGEDRAHKLEGREISRGRVSLTAGAEPSYHTVLWNHRHPKETVVDLYDTINSSEIILGSFNIENNMGS